MYRFYILLFSYVYILYITILLCVDFIYYYSLMCRLYILLFSYLKNLYMTFLLRIDFIYYYSLMSNFALVIDLLVSCYFELTRPGLHPLSRRYMLKFLMNLNLCMLIDVMLI